MKATILEAEKVREVERVDDVEVEDQGHDGTVLAWRIRFKRNDFHDTVDLSKNVVWKKKTFF